MKYKLLNLLLTGVLFFAFSSPVISAENGDAYSCVSVGMGKQYKSSKKEAPYIMNTCDEVVTIAWCHTSSTREKYLCGGGKFYRWSTFYKPGEKNYNPYTIPEGTDFKYAACRGQFSISSYNSDGTVICKTEMLEKKFTGISLQCSEEKAVKGKIQILGTESSKVYRYRVNGRNYTSAAERADEAITNICADAGVEQVERSILDKGMGYLRERTRKIERSLRSHCNTNPDSPHCNKATAIGPRG